MSHPNDPTGFDTFVLYTFLAFTGLGWLALSVVGVIVGGYAMFAGLIMIGMLCAATYLTVAEVLRR